MIKFQFLRLYSVLAKNFIPFENFTELSKAFLWKLLFKYLSKLIIFSFDFLHSKNVSKLSGTTM